MGMFLFLLSFPVAIAVWYFLAKKMKASGKGLSRHVAGFFLGFFAWLVICIIAVYSDPKARDDLAKSNAEIVAAEKTQQQVQIQPAQQSAQKQPAPDEQSADIQNLIELHKSTMTKYNEMELASTQLSNEFAAKKIDLFKVYESAEKLYTIAKSVQTDTRPIELKNEKANKSAKSYIDNIKTLGYIRSEIASVAKNVSNGDSSYKPSDQVELKKQIEAAKTANLMIAIDLLSAYEALGIKSGQVDFKNGGLKK